MASISRQLSGITSQGWLVKQLIKVIDLVYWKPLLAVITTLIPSCIVGVCLGVDILV